MTKERKDKDKDVGINECDCHDMLSACLAMTEGVWGKKIWLPFTVYAEILNTETKIRIQSKYKYKYAGYKVCDCHDMLSACLAMTEGVQVVENEIAAVCF